MNLPAIAKRYLESRAQSYIDWAQVRRITPRTPLLAQD